MPIFIHFPSFSSLVAFEDEFGIELSAQVVTSLIKADGIVKYLEEEHV